MKFLLSILATLIMTTLAHSNDAINQSLGNLEEIKRENNSVLITTGNGKVELTVYRPSVIRIHAVKKYFSKKVSYAVTAQPEDTRFSIEEEEDYYLLETDSVRLIITKEPVRFEFQTPEGQIINQDDHALGTSWLGEECGVYKKLQDDERFIGLGEKTGPLDRRGEAYVNWNTDNPNHRPGDDPLYASIPFYIGIHSGINYGIFFDNSYRSHFNFGASNDRFSWFTADAGEIDYYFIYHEKVKDIIRSYSWLTGRMPMPPKWALGYQQCRWSYFPDSEILNVARTFREKNIPADVIYFDIHYMQDYKLFTWSDEHFPNPEKTINKLQEMDFHSAVIIDPGVKIEKGYDIYEDGVKNDVFIKYPDGSNYTAKVWPGWCHFPDFTDPKVRKWWGNKFDNLVSLGVEGFWNDMNEIASWGGGATPNIVEFDWEGHKTSYRQAKNVYGMQMARSTFEGAKAQMNNKRPFSLTRAGFAGLQRYTALWTGDNQATEEHMMLGVRLVNSIGLSGVPFAGVDVGGFGGDASKELFARWMTIGAFSPFFRGHTAYDTRSSEPWTYGETVEEISRNYIQLRYNLLPYLYSVFYEAKATGMPVARSLAIRYAHDDKVYQPAFENQYLLGPCIMVAPNKSHQKLTKVYLPAGQWYHFFGGAMLEGNQEIAAESPLEQLPLFVKAGSIIPMQSAVESTSEAPRKTLFLHLYKGDQPSEFEYYEDDGVSYDYLEGAFYERIIKYLPEKKMLVMEKPQGNYPSHFKEVKLILHGFENKMVSVNGTSSELKTEHFSMIHPYTGKSQETYKMQVKTVSFELHNDKTEIYFD